MTRRSVVIALSICVHATVLLMLMTADLWRPIAEWPAPRKAMAFVDDVLRPVHLEDIELPKRAVHANRSSVSATATTATTVVTKAPEFGPAEAPSGVTHETGNEGLVARNARLGEVELRGGEVEALGTPVAPAAPPPASLLSPVRLHSGIRAPQRIVHVTPVYPSVARDARVEGMVIIEATIDEQGNVARAQILKSIPFLDEAALTAVRQWKFSPTLLNGIAVPIVMTVTVNFSLH
jgi:protein TonB